MDRATRRAVVIRVLVVAATLLVMVVIALARGSGAEAAVDQSRAQYAAVVAVMASFDSEVIRPIDYSEVVDAASARGYLEQTARLFVDDESEPTSGVYQYASIPATAAAEFHRSLGVAEGEWAGMTTGRIVLMLWRAEEGTFRPPYRPGGGGNVVGDTLVVLLEPASGLETRGIVAYAQTANLRSSAIRVTTGDLTIGGIAPR